MNFVVVAPSRGTPDALAQVVLQQDRWDDFGFKTQYHVFYFGPEFEGLVGNVKILQIGQEESSYSILQVGPLNPLPDDFCSLGQSLDYYERLASLPEEARREILATLRDALTDPDNAKRFLEEKGWATSVTRDLDLESYRPLALTLLERDYTALPSMGLDLSFHVTGWTNPLRLHFAGPGGDDIWIIGRSRPSSRLPERVAVITGRNGSGKSTLLARLARVLHASQSDRAREAIGRLGRIEPPGVGFTRIITIAYSAFDTFQVPGLNAAEKRQIITDLRAGSGRYVFAGLRDIARELEDRMEHADTPPAELPEDAYGFAVDRLDDTHLKSADQLADEFERTVATIFKDDRSSLFARVLGLLLADASFADVPEQSVSALLGEDARSSFKTWSTGHKIVMHIAATLVAHAQPKSIVLIDEPESHLHPPLLAALMHAVRLVLDEVDAFAVVATHSPVVTQETLGRHVSVVSRAEDVFTILAPKIETYGESIGEITDEVFGLHPGATDYHQTLRSLVDSGLSLEAIEERFDRGMSLQARAFVMSLIGARGA